MIAETIKDIKDALGSDFWPLILFLSVLGIPVGWKILRSKKLKFSRSGIDIVADDRDEIPMQEDDFFRDLSILSFHAAKVESELPGKQQLLRETLKIIIDSFSFGLRNCLNKNSKGTSFRFTDSGTEFFQEFYIFYKTHLEEQLKLHLMEHASSEKWVCKSISWQDIYLSRVHAWLDPFDQAVSAFIKDIDTIQVNLHFSDRQVFGVALHTLFALITQMASAAVQGMDEINGDLAGMLYRGQIVSKKHKGV